MLSAADAALPERLRDMLGTFPNGVCQGASGSGQPQLDAGRTTLSLSLTCVSFAWPAGASATVAATGVTVTVTSRGAVTLTLGGTFDKVEVTSTVTTAGSAQLTAAVRPTRPGAFATALEDLGERFGGDVWQSAQEGLREFGFDLGDIAGFDYRLAKGQQAVYTVTSVAVVADLDIKTLPLQVAVWLPDLRVTGRVRGDKPLGVGSLLESFGIPAGELPSELSVSDLSFAAALGDAYILRMKVTGLWRIEHFAITSLSVNLSYDEGEFVATVAGTAKIGSLGIDVLAAMSGGATGGWTFQGGLAAGEDLGVAEVITALGLTDVPEPVKSLELTGLWFSHTTGSGGGYEALFQGDMTIADGIRASLGVTATRDDSGTRYTGTLEVDGFEFDVVFDKDGSGIEVFAATFHGPDGGIEIVLRDWVAHLSADLAADVPDSLRIGLKDAKFVRVKPAKGPARFCLGVDLSADIDLSQLPLVGGFLSSVGTLSVQNLQVLYSSGDIAPEAVGVVNGLLRGVVPLPAAGLKTGVAALAELRIGSETTPVALGVPAAGAPASPGGGQPNTPAVPDRGSPTAQDSPSGTSGAQASTVQWISVQKKLGVVQINRVGVMYQHNVLFFALDVSVALGPLSLSLDGLAVGSPLDRFEPTFNLDGLGIGYSAAPVEIAGALLHLPASRLAPDVAFQYDGAATIALPNFSLAAVGSYAQLDSGEPSLFVFAQLEGPLLELPPILITGLMAGFGFNRELALPSAAEVTGFPLLVLNKQGPEADQGDPSQVLKVLEGQQPAVRGGRARQWIAPRQGSYWLALGVEFSAAEVVNAKVLLAAEFGQELALAVLGIATLQLPLPAESPRTYVYAELGLEAVIRPAHGSVEVAAQLSPASYVLTPACHLTGGFACAMWFGPSPNAGQFVVTLGGYHPAFQPPASYPRVPRLGIDWAVSSNVSVKAQGYLAVTPSCAMAGGRLEVVFHTGGFRAWFTAQADLLLSWRPFHFTASISVSIGASYQVDVWFVHKTIQVSVGAELELWGPPTGGSVTAHFACFSKTISFGPGRSVAGTRTLQWPEFAGMLPKPEDVVTIAPVSGLDKSVDDARHGGKVWLVRARDLRLFTQAAIPASHLRTGKAPLSAPQAGDGPLVDVRPMKRGGLVGEHRLKLYYQNALAPTEGWTLTPRTRNLPASLWGAPQSDQSPSAEVVPDRPVGFDVQAPRPSLAPSRGVFPLSEYSEDELPPGLSPLPQHPAANHDFVSAADPSCVDLIGRADRGDAKDGRDQVYAALAEAKLFTGSNDTLAGLAQGAGHLFSQAPMTQDAGSRT
ncbi:DUF6603 domain-containing protein [Streptosporangium sp. CA-135522]|uniref:DUF6603 domain-containing protein n=1 Tax=Streptosporangium sp. CA-135522 TaxID=3240072 RepID=UPI003D8CD1C1